MFALIPTWVKIAVAGIIGAGLLLAGTFALGKREGRSQATAEIESKAAKEALERIGKLEQNNASFRNLDARHRCIVFARDSGLPDTICD